MEGFKRCFKYYCSKCTHIDDRKFDANNYSTNCPRCKIPMSHHEIQDDIQTIQPEDFETPNVSVHVDEDKKIVFKLK